ncbi:cytochrome c oxidase assembly protein [Marinimicrobium sp. ABcell2]|uniref:cytochrome c oxidase assembly protein n=1 Tax=Marinimicrobium sp. ABcell2 TaxID=3069751 RepID=UPI0027B0C008|nr:cytochrome c oxidase assembly protein [Marinimicrobium sp. ABcell2]MDQ2076840.1 cytochrome c oxidase assembly protein [Marinimicrobium sp. ABcell2]
MRVIGPCLLGLLFYSPVAMAHNPLSSDGQEQLAAIVSALLLMAFWGIYGLGSWRRRPTRGQAFLFHGSALLCALALLGPLDDWAKTSTAAHMTQHMMLMVVIAPLWVLSRPLPQMVAGAGRVALWCSRPMLRLVRHPMLTAYLHAAAIWIWHTPVFYMVAVEDPWWHAFEHACFLLTAGWFWWSIMTGSERRAPWALLALLFTLMHTGFLGALLTFAQTPLYDEARSLTDQQLAGLIMWVLGAIPYLGVSAWIGHRWYRQLVRRMEIDKTYPHA